MLQNTRKSFSPEFRLEVAQLVADQGYTVREAAKAMDVGVSTVSKWVTQLKRERSGTTVDATPLTPDQRRIKELERRIKRIELEKEVLKKATALLMSDSMKY